MHAPDTACRTRQNAHAGSPSPAAHKGLSDRQAEEARQRYGANLLSTVKPVGFFRHFLRNLGDPVIRILLCALGVNLLFVFRGGDVAETVGIGVSVLLATLISTLSERGSEAAFRRLSEEYERTEVRVWRNGVLRLLAAEELVVGDCLLLGAGEQIPADGWVTEGRLTVDQSAMTGESREAEKLACGDRAKSPHGKSAVLRGCAILTGEAEVEVFAVGDATFLGQISQEVQLRTRDSPLKLRLRKLAGQISRLGYAAAFLVAAAYLLNIFVIDSGFHLPLILMKLHNPSFCAQQLLHALMLGLTVIVVAVPEGLPMMIAVVLSANIRRMLRDRVLVRTPVGIEAAGSMNLLFTDKTGTLTEGKMSVGQWITADGRQFASLRALQAEAPRPAELFVRSCRCNTASRWSEGAAVGGNATDRALLEAVGGGDRAGVAEVLPFDSVRKLSAVRLTGRVPRVLLKGAPERLLPFVRYAYGRNGEVLAFSSALSYPFLQRLSALTAEGGRVLLLAEGERMPSGDGTRPSELGELTLIGAVLLRDRLRAEARTAVQTLHGAGIQVVMMTGDNRDTAQSIAKACGICNSQTDCVLTGEELARLSDGEVRHLLPRLAVVARALPTDKSRLVRIAQEAERVVGMTGDGINDAPALKRADIGFAMGTGTHVARDAGDIIILDNNLSSIAKAVLYGRTVFKSIRKFITLQLMMNFCAVGVSMLGPFVGFDAPVTVVQMLWINIIMDTLGGLAFAGEAPLPSCMREKPKRRDEPILNGYMIHQIVVLGGFTVALFMGFLLLPGFTSHFRSAPNRLCLLTAFFALFIFTSVFHCFNARTDRLNLFAGLSQNRPFLAIMSLICAIQLLFVYFGGSVLRTMPLTRRELLFTLAVALAVFPVELVRKLWWRLRGRGGGF